MTETKGGLLGRISRYSLVIILLLAFTGLATFAVMSDTSIHGLTVRFYNVSWTCASNSTNINPVLTFEFGSVIVYSSASLPTSLSHVTFAMSTTVSQSAQWRPRTKPSPPARVLPTPLPSATLRLTQGLSPFLNK